MSLCASLDRLKKELSEQLGDTERDGVESHFFFSSRRRHTRWNCDWGSDVCSSDLFVVTHAPASSTRSRGSSRASTIPLFGPSGEIGRASCRERVESEAVAVALK